jgi:hypothetical protein
MTRPERFHDLGAAAILAQLQQFERSESLAPMPRRMTLRAASDRESSANRVSRVDCAALAAAPGTDRVGSPVVG